MFSRGWMIFSILDHQQWSEWFNKIYYTQDSDFIKDLKIKRVTWDFGQSFPKRIAQTHRQIYTESHRGLHTQTEIQRSTYSLFASCNKLLVPSDLWDLAKCGCSELLTILLHQHLSADDFWTLSLCQHLSVDHLENPLKIYSSKSSQNPFFELLMPSILRGTPAQGEDVGSHIACWDPEEL